MILKKPGPQDSNPSSELLRLQEEETQRLIKALNELTKKKKLQHKKNPSQ